MVMSIPPVKSLVGCGIRKQGSNGDEHRIGDHQLFEVTPRDAQKPAGDHAPVGTVRGIQLLCKLGIPADGSLHQLREETDKQGKAERILLRPGFSAVNVDEIPHRLKDIKRKSEREQERRHRDGSISIKKMNDGIQVADGKAGILEHGEKPEAEYQPGGKDQAALPLSLCAVSLALLLGDFVSDRGNVRVLPRLRPGKQSSRDISNGSGEHEKREARKPREGVKHETADQKKDPLGTLRKQVVQKQQYAEKREKRKRDERHGAILLSWV